LSVRALAALIVLLVAGAAPADALDPTAQQKARCDTAANERARTQCLAGYSVPALKFPDEAEDIDAVSTVARMGIYKPKGAGPFPALLVLHTCGPVNGDPPQVRFWVGHAVEAGYVAFVVDSWTQRGIREVCRTPPPPPITNAVLALRARDAYEALAHLTRFAFVDRTRVAAIGFSNGGRTVYLLGSREIAKWYAANGAGFAALVSVYGQCFNREFGRNYLLPDVDRPLLALLGDRDEDGDVRDCLPRLEALKAKGAPVEWHVYRGAGHAWDSPNFRVPRRQVEIGNADGVYFAYDAGVAEDSRVRAFAFLSRYLDRQ